MLLQEANVPMDILSYTEKLGNYIKTNFPEHTLVQEKYNGERCLVSIKDGKITALRNRSDIPILQYFPELLKLEFPFKEALLDGEICVLNQEGKSIFYNEKDKDKIVQAGIQGRSKSIKDERFIKKFPVTLVLFDTLKVDGNLMVNKVYTERYKKLLEIKENLNLIIARNQKFKEAWEQVKNQDLEGVVLKNPNSLYEVGNRSKNFIKLKYYKIIEITINKIEENNKGYKVTGKSDGNIDVEVQIPNKNVNVGSKVKIKYLEKIKGEKGFRLTQPTIFYG